MRRLILSDIHGNIEALEAVLNDARGLYDEVLCCGDIVGYGASPRETVARVRESAALVVRGNHDRAVWEPGVKESFTSAARIAVAWCAGSLDAADLNWLSALPSGPLWRDDFGLVHGAPDDEDAYVEYAADTRGLEPLLARSPCFFGHTHIQGGWMWLPDVVRKLPVPSLVESQRIVTLDPGARYFVNPGSVGQPRDRDPRAAYAVWDSIANEIEFRRVAYDIASAQRRILAAGLPESLARRLALGR